LYDQPEIIPLELPPLGLSREEISPTKGLKPAWRRKRKPQPDPDSLSLRGILINLFGWNYVHHFCAFLSEHGIIVTEDQARSFMYKNYLPDHIAPVLDQHGPAYAQRWVDFESEKVLSDTLHWIASRKLCYELGCKATKRLCLAGQNEKVTVGPWNGTFRPPAQKRLNPREALAKGASPGAHAEATPNQATAPERVVGNPAADLLDAWFPPRPKNPSVKV